MTCAAFISIFFPMGTTTIPTDVYSVEPKNKLNYLSLGGKTIWLCVKRGRGGGKFGCCGETGRGLMLADMTLKERCSDLNDVGSHTRYTNRVITTEISVLVE